MGLTYYLFCVLVSETTQKTDLILLDVITHINHLQTNCAGGLRPGVLTKRLFHPERSAAGGNVCSVQQRLSPADLFLSNQKAAFKMAQI